MPYDPNKIEERLLVVTDKFAELIAAAAYIAAAPAIPVLTERKGDISNEITRALNTLGISITIITPDGDSLVENGELLNMRVRLVAEISENVLINQGKAAASQTTYRPALGVTLAALKAVHRQPNGLDIERHMKGLNEFLLPEDEPPYRLVPAQRPTYHVTAYTVVEF